MLTIPLNLGAPNRNQTCLRLASNPTRNINPAQNLVRPPGIEPGSSALQAAAMTTSAKDASLDQSINCSIVIPLRTLKSG